MDIPLGAEVRCTDGRCGKSTYIVVDPIMNKITHVVIREAAFPHAERLVPTDVITETAPNLIHLRCDSKDLAKMDAFVVTEFREPNAKELAEFYGSFQADEEGVMLWPYVQPRDALIPVERERIPPNELAVRRGAAVEATNGRVGHVDEFLVDPASGNITHLVLRESHLVVNREVTIPVSDILRIEENTVFLRCSKEEVAALPSIPIAR
jgi:sporulation protein YlmC with PRC-barrel domain